MSAEITLIPGDGNGPELLAAARRALDATGADLAWDEQPASEPDAVLDSVRRTRVALRGPTDEALDARLRSGLGVHASVLHCKAIEGARTRFPETDLVVVRERDGSGVAFKRADRVVRTACDHARAHDRRAVIAAHSAGEDRGPVREAAAAHSEDLEFSDVDVGPLCAGLVAHPEGYDVLVLPDLLGGIVGQLGAGMIGGLGLAPGIGVGDDATVFEAAYDGANPTALMLAGVLMLRHLGDAPAADRLHAAVAGVIRRGETVTSDLKPGPNDPSAVGTSEFADAVLEAIQKGTH